MTNQRLEALMRIIVGIVSGIIFSVWHFFVKILMLVNFLITLISGTRNKELARLCEIWTTNLYHFIKYMTFGTNTRPFTQLKQPLTKFEK
jgi:hypothetical protein